MLLQCKFPASSISSSAGWRWRYPVRARSRFRWKLHPFSQAWPLLSTSNRGETAIAKCGSYSSMTQLQRWCKLTAVGARAWISNFVSSFYEDVFPYPCLNVSTGAINDTEPILKVNNLRGSNRHYNKTITTTVTKQWDISTHTGRSIRCIPSP